MKNKKKSIYKIALGVFAAYLILLLLLYLSESSDPQSKIQSFGDAIWYSIVTLTTVGYGDLTPHTTLGIMIGGIFLILSMGLLVTLMSTAFSFFTSEALPMFQLHFLKKKNWYYFCDFGPESNLMAQDIVAHDDDAVIIFGEQKDKEIEVPAYPCFFINETPVRLVEIKDSYRSTCKIFFMKENDIYHNIRAIDIDALPVQIYAHTTSGKEKISENMHFFHSYDCCARQYWMDNLMQPEEKSVVIIGFGNYGRSILERAIMLNVFAPDQHVAYHIFGDATEFCQVHSNLDHIFSVNEVSDHQDMLFFHEDTWRTEHKLLEEADRIIICDDEEEEAWKILWIMKRYYVTRGEIFIRSNQQVSDVHCFGSAETIYTCDNILRTVQNRLAIALNDRFRKVAQGNYIPWDDLDDLLKQSKMAVADHLIMKCRILLADYKIDELNLEICEQAYKRFHWLKRHPGEEIETPDCPESNVNGMQLHLEIDHLRAIEHLRWLRYYCFYNWQYGSKRNDTLHTHPMMVPYEQLTIQQKISRDYSWELLNDIRDLL